MLKKITKTALITLVTLITLQSSHALAGDPYAYTIPESEASGLLSRVQANFILEKPSDRYQTRVSILVVDAGGSTDVSPTLNLYLTFWRDGEMYDTSSLFDLGSSYSLVDFKKISHGRWILKQKKFTGSGFEIVDVVIDYSAFLQKFNRESVNGSEFDGINWVHGSVYRDRY